MRRFFTLLGFGIIISMVVTFAQTSVWNQKGGDINGSAADDKAGLTVSINSDGTIMAIGAPGNDDGGTNSGHVRVFELTTTTKIKTIKQDDISIYPNPTNKIINIRSKENDIQQITIFNITGETILKRTGIQKDETIDLSDYKKGIYIIRIQTDIGIVNKKIVKR